MSESLIAGTYRLISQIGAGGGGIVYLGEHIRLGKQVVLKADRRTLTANPEALRREVDALMNLSHTYIPQVYDFIEENGIIYTVMDFIEGESFDKPLSRGDRFSQANIIEWACQLLDALHYLHTRPPHGILHADIKPSNVMLTSQGDVRLIDFNIALALGAEGAVVVGYSTGYASPEHYSRDYMSHVCNPQSTVSTVLMGAPTATLGHSPDLIGKKKTVMLNVVSDIYSLGATLYHIISGRRPAKNAIDVVPIQSNDYSTGFLDIITRAMNPEPHLRWQSAEEMLKAFRDLRGNHVLVKRHKRRILTATVIFSLMFMLGIFTTFAGQRRIQLEQQQVMEVVLMLEDEQRRVAEEQRQIAEEQSRIAQLYEARIVAEHSLSTLRDGNVSAAIGYALQALSISHIAEAQRALADALGVYDLSDGFKNHRTVELPSSPLNMAISPNGNLAAAIYAFAVAILCTNSAEILATLPTRQSALAEVRFLNNDVIIFSGDAGITAYDVANSVVLWTGRPATAISIAADGRSVAAIYRNEDFATVYDTLTGNILHEIDFDGRQQRVVVNDIFANPGDNLFALNQDGTMLGVSFVDGSLWIFDLRDRYGDIELFDDTSGFTWFTGGFYREFFAFSSASPSGSLFAVIDTAEMVQTGGFDSTNPFTVQAGERGIFVQTENIVVNIHPVTGEQTARITTFERVTEFAHSGTHTLITTQDEFMFFDGNANLIARHEKEHGSEFLHLAAGTALIGSLDSPVIRIMRHESHPDANVFSYDPSYRHDEARISAGWQTVMLYSFRGFRLYNINGALITEVEMQNAAYVHNQLFIRDDDGCRLEVIFNDGTVRTYSATDGGFISETVGATPDLTLFEEFFTDTLIIESPLHGTPRVYDIVTGRFIRELERDAFLAHVTQIGEYTLTEYVTGSGYRFGLLLNSNLDAVAYLPHLSDFIGGYLIFNYPTGNLRKSRIFTIYELTELAQNH